MTDTRLGDYILVASMSLNATVAVAYGVQGHWRMVEYWLAAFQLNYWLMKMR